MNPEDIEPTIMQNTEPVMWGVGWLKAESCCEPVEL